MHMAKTHLHLPPVLLVVAKPATTLANTTGESRSLQTHLLRHVASPKHAQPPWNDGFPATAVDSLEERPSGYSPSNALPAPGIRSRSLLGAGPSASHSQSPGVVPQQPPRFPAQRQKLNLRDATQQDRRKPHSCTSLLPSFPTSSCRPSFPRNAECCITPTVCVTRRALRLPHSHLPQAILALPTPPPNTPTRLTHARPATPKRTDCQNRNPRATLSTVPLHPNTLAHSTTTPTGARTSACASPPTAS